MLDIPPPSDILFIPPPPPPFSFPIPHNCQEYDHMTLSLDCVTNSVKNISAVFLASVFILVLAMLLLIRTRNSKRKALINSSEIQDKICNLNSYQDCQMMEKTNVIPHEYHVIDKSFQEDHIYATIEDQFNVISDVAETHQVTSAQNYLVSLDVRDLKDLELLASWCKKEFSSHGKLT